MSRWRDAWHDSLSMSWYAGITDPACACFTAISNGSRKTSFSSRQPRCTGPWLRAPSLHEWPGEVLQGREQIALLALQAADEPRAQHADEIRVLGQRLLGAAPAHVARDVEHRRQALVAAHATGPRARWPRAARSMRSGFQVAP